MNEAARVKFLKIFLSLVFLFFLGKLFELQLYRSLEYKRQAESNSIRTIQHDPIRGLIFDRNGKIIAWTINLPVRVNRTCFKRGYSKYHFKS